MQKNLSLKRHNQSGFTLVEVMVAMVITLIVMGGVYRTLSDEEVNHDRSEKILDMQNNARLALERIAKDVRRTGSFGCGGTEITGVLQGALPATDPHTTFVNDFTIATNPPGRDWDGEKTILTLIKELAAGGTNVNFLGEVIGFSDNAPATNGLYREGTDAISLVYFSDERALAAPMGNNTNPVPVTSAAFGTGDILYITDCTNYTLFQSSSSNTSSVQHTGGMNTTADLGNNYRSQLPARVSKLNVTTYFIHKGKYTLNLNKSSSPLASNIEDLQFEFLADENDDGSLDGEVWRTNLAGYGAGGNAVRAVRIWLLAMSEPDYSYTDTNTYVYPNSRYVANTPAQMAPMNDPPDGEHRHRYLVSAVVYLRNAGLS